MDETHDPSETTWHDVPGWNSAIMGTAEDAERAKVHLSRLAEGMCPNGCAPLKRISPHEEGCPVCHYYGWSNVPKS